MYSFFLNSALITYNFAEDTYLIIKQLFKIQIFEYLPQMCMEKSMMQNDLFGLTESKNRISFKKKIIKEEL